MTYPREPDTAWFIPEIKDEKRVTAVTRLHLSKPHTSNAAAHGRFVLWGNAARLDESRQERRSHTE
jgi:hypothetical protein